MTTRLNNEHRNALYALARKVVDETLPSTGLLDESYKTQALEIVPIVHAEFPPAEMAILKKYETARQHDVFKFVSASSSDVFEVSLLKGCIRSGYKTDEAWLRARNNTGILVPDTYSARGKIMKATKNLTSLHYDGEAIWKKHRVAYEEMLGRYTAIIQHYKTYEALVEVWPEAATISHAIRANLPAVINDQMIEKIRAESLARMEKKNK